SDRSGPGGPLTYLYLHQFDVVVRPTVAQCGENVCVIPVTDCYRLVFSAHCLRACSTTAIAIASPVAIKTSSGMPSVMKVVQSIPCLRQNSRAPLLQYLGCIPRMCACLTSTTCRLWT